MHLVLDKTSYVDHITGTYSVNLTLIQHWIHFLCKNYKRFSNLFWDLFNQCNITLLSYIDQQVAAVISQWEGHMFKSQLGQFCVECAWCILYMSRFPQGTLISSNKSWSDDMSSVHPVMIEIWWMNCINILEFPHDVANFSNNLVFV